MSIYPDTTRKDVNVKRFSYVALPLDALYDRADLLPILEAATTLPAKFGLSPSEVTFCTQEAVVKEYAIETGGEHLWRRERPFRVLETDADGCDDVRGVTPKNTPWQCHLMVTELVSEGVYKHRTPAAVFKTFLHEFAHRLQFEDVVDWPFDKDNGRCSTHAERFADFVSVRSTPRMIVLHDNVDWRYNDIAREARQKRAASTSSTVHVVTEDGVVEVEIPDYHVAVA